MNDAQLFIVIERRKAHGIQSANGWSQVPRRANSLWCASNLHKAGHGVVRGSAECSPDWRSIGKTIAHGSVQVERHISKPCD